MPHPRLSETNLEDRRNEDLSLERPISMSGIYIIYLDTKGCSKHTHTG
jgi:hypothetical protein